MKTVTRAIAVAVICAASSSAFADCYEYDELKRLKGVVYSQGGDANYVLDKHGNRQSLDITLNPTSCTNPSTTPSQAEDTAVTSAAYNTTNGAPVSQQFSITLTQAGTATADPIAYASDPEDDPLYIVSASTLHTSDISVSVNANGADLTITSIGAVGIFSVSYVLSDGIDDVTGGIDVEVTASGGGGGTFPPPPPECDPNDNTIECQ